MNLILTYWFWQFVRIGLWAWIGQYLWFWQSGRNSKPDNRTFHSNRAYCENRAQLLNLTWINTLHISLAKRPQVSDSKKTILSDSMQKSGSKEHRNYRASGSNTRLTISDLVHTPANRTIGQSGARLSDSLTSAQFLIRYNAFWSKNMFLSSSMQNHAESSSNFLEK